MEENSIGGKNESAKRLQALHWEESFIQNTEAEEKGEGEKDSQEQV